MLILFLGCYIYVNQGGFVEVSDIHAASIFRVIVRVYKGGEILSIHMIPFCKTVGKGRRVEIGALSGPTGTVGWESYAASPHKGSGMHQKNRLAADIPKQSPIQVFTGHNVT
jgi:hypothetical protein